MRWKARLGKVCRSSSEKVCGLGSGLKIENVSLRAGEDILEGWLKVSGKDDFGWFR